MLEVKVQPNELKFYTIKEFSEVFGCCISTAQEIYNRPDFPSCDFAKEKKAEAYAIREYFRKPRRK